MGKARQIISTVLILTIIISTTFYNYAENVGSSIFLIKESVAEMNSNADETETTYRKAFIEETEAGLSIVEYERKKLQELEESKFDVSDEEIESEETEDSFENEETSEEVNLLESAIAEKISKDLNNYTELSDDSFSNAYSETSSEEIPNLNNKTLTSKIDETTE